MDAKFGPDRFVIVGVNLDAEQREGLDFLRRFPVDFPMLSDRTGNTSALYGLSTLPVSVLIDQEGEWVATIVGYRSSDLRALERALDVLLAP